MNMGQVTLHVDTGGDQLTGVPEALPQIAQVGHHDNAVGLSLPPALLLQRVQRGYLTLQRHLAQGYRVRQLGKAGNTDQQEGDVYPCGAASGHLLQTAGADLLRTCCADHAGYLRHTAYALDNAAYLNTAGLAAGNDLLRVMIQPVQMDLQTGKMPVHGSHLILNCRTSAVILV